jgi:hypothetical protein
MALLLHRTPELKSFSSSFVETLPASPGIVILLKQFFDRLRIVIYTVEKSFSPLNTSKCGTQHFY